MFVPWKIQKIQKGTVLENGETPKKGFSGLESGDRDLIFWFWRQLYLLTFNMLIWVISAQVNRFLHLAWAVNHSITVLKTISPFSAILHGCNSNSL